MKYKHIFTGDVVTVTKKTKKHVEYIKDVPQTNDHGTPINAHVKPLYVFEQLYERI